MGFKRGQQQAKSPVNWRIVAVVVVALFGMVYLYSRSFSADPAVALRGGPNGYAVMIDAGSTGSRIHVYSFRVQSNTNVLLVEEVFESLKPGLSSFAAEPAAAARSLEPLLAVAMESVPAAFRARTPINLKATAGLRLLKAHETEAILASARSSLQRLPFYYDPDDAVEVMGGDDEGLFSWVTVNYLLRTLSYDAPQTAVTLDLGGGSTQVALSVQGGFPGTTRTSVMGFTHDMYLYSHLGYGLMAGRAGVLAHGLPEGDPRLTASGKLETACLARGERQPYAYGDRSFDLVGTGTAARACEEQAANFMRDPLGSFGKTKGAPTPAKGQPVFAMSYYLDRAIGAKMVAPDVTVAHVSPVEFEAAASTLCALSAAEITARYPDVHGEDAPFMCLDLCFIRALLLNGFNLDPQATLTLARKLPFNGQQVETQWALGASIAELSETRAQLAAAAV